MGHTKAAESSCLCQSLLSKPACHPPHCTARCTPPAHISEILKVAHCLGKASPCWFAVKKPS